MLSEGAVAPGFELPAVVDGEARRVELSEYLGDDVVILAFYPADFNPACDHESCDLDELDLFTMQKDVTILGISPDSVYSHRAFAEQYDLKIPLLADTEGEVADQYDIELVDDIGQRLLERAVAVVDHDGTITYSWSTDNMTELPRVEEIKNALAETGGDDTAFARYRVGHAHYTEGRRAFTSAMESFQNTEWVMAQHDFQQAREEFEAAADRFDTAVRFVDDASLVPIYEGANEKATALWQAADWLTRSASAYSSGSGSKGQELRDDAEIPLSTVREYEEPPDPDDEWPPEMENLEKADSDDRSLLPTEPEVEDAALDLDIDEEVDGDDAAVGIESAAETDESASIKAEMSSDGAADEVDADDADDAADADDDIDDDELAEIQAELAANNPESEPSVDELTEESTAIVEAPPMAESDDETDDADETTDEDAVDDLPEESTSIVDPPSMGESDQDTESAGGTDEPGAAPAEQASADGAGADDATGDPADGAGIEADQGAVDDASGETSEEEPAVDTADEEPFDDASGETTEEEPAVDTADEPVAEDADDASVDRTEGALPDGSPAAADDSEGGPAGDSPDTDIEGSEQPGPGESEQTAVDEPDEADADESEQPGPDESEQTAVGEPDEADADDSGPELELELAEPDPDPIDTDGPPVPPADESDGESGPDE